jgi:hypothetical protein
MVFGKGGLGVVKYLMQLVNGCGVCSGFGLVGGFGGRRVVDGDGGGGGGGCWVGF